ncbi:MAG: hypothetical protein ACXIVE_06675 [Salinarimonas sp.]
MPSEVNVACICFLDKSSRPERVIKLAHYQQIDVLSDLRTSELHPYTAVKINSICPPPTRTLMIAPVTAR